jgi:XRE family transcriptional regulator, aerobic/anaerobic benzoate catabolism transcriptional regulator
MGPSLRWDDEIKDKRTGGTRDEGPVTNPSTCTDDDYLVQLGKRVRAARKNRQMSRQDLSFTSGVSMRYLAQLETGAGNASINVLRQIAEATGLTVEDLAADADPDGLGLIAAIRGATAVERMYLMDALTEMRRASGGDDPRAARVALIGLRGAGKSTLGRAIGEHSRVPFVELNHRIEAESGLSIPEVFSLYGDAGYRRLEKRCIEAVMAAHDRVVLAVGGGIVGEAGNYDLLLGGFHTVWLRATPEEHMARVRAQGDERPMRGKPQAMDELRGILEARDRLYVQADAQLSTSGKTVAESTASLAVVIEAVLGRAWFG